MQGIDELLGSPDSKCRYQETSASCNRLVDDAAEFCLRVEVGRMVSISVGAFYQENIASLDDYRWKSCCRGLYQLPIAA